jgi:hypothetical protein
VVDVLAAGTPAAGGFYSFQIVDDPADAEDDTSIAAFISAPACPDASSCTGKLKGLAAGVVTVRVTFFNTSLPSAVSGSVTSLSGPASVQSPLRKIRFNRVRVDTLWFLGSRADLSIDTEAGFEAIYNGPHWQHTGSAPALEQKPVWYVGASEPPAVPYKKIKLSVNLRFNPEYPAPKPGVVLEGISSAGFVFRKTITIPADAASESYTIEADDFLPTTTKFYNPLTVTWTLQFAPTGPKVEIGKTANKIYSSFEPRGGGFWPQTAVHLAVANDGAVTRNEAVLRTWSAFASRAVTTWNGAPLKYYDPLAATMVNPHTPQHFIEDMLMRRNGQCRTFVVLISLAWGVNGASTRETVVTSRDGRKMFVNRWGFIAPPIGATYTMPGQFYVAREPLPPGIYDYLENMPGLAGQNTSTPGQKIFDDHVIARFRFGTIGPWSTDYYDPSYGTTYTGEADFEAKAIGGFGVLTFDTGGFRFRVEPRLLPMNNINFN